MKKMIRLAAFAATAVVMGSSFASAATVIKNAPDTTVKHGPMVPPDPWSGGTFQK